MSVDPMIVYYSWYHGTIKYSYLALLRADIHKIPHFPSKSKTVVNYKDDSSDINYMKTPLFEKLTKRTL